MTEKLSLTKAHAIVGVTKLVLLLL